MRFRRSWTYTARQTYSAASQLVLGSYGDDTSEDKDRRPALPRLQQLSELLSISAEDMLSIGFLSFVFPEAQAAQPGRGAVRKLNLTAFGTDHPFCFVREPVLERYYILNLYILEHTSITIL